ncbi:MAG: hypothetical protein MJY64_00155 [archaeon]|nr:hypothetical protein [archaeon]
MKRHIAYSVLIGVIVAASAEVIATILVKNQVPYSDLIIPSLILVFALAVVAIGITKITKCICKKSCKKESQK